MEDEARVMYADEAEEVVRLRRLSLRWKLTALGYRRDSHGAQRAWAMYYHYEGMANAIGRAA